MIVDWEFTQVINAEESLNIPSVPGIRKKNLWSAQEVHLPNSCGQPLQRTEVRLDQKQNFIIYMSVRNCIELYQQFLHWIKYKVPDTCTIAPFQPQTLQRSSRSHLGHHTNGKGGSICFPIPCLSTGRYYAQKLFVWTLIYLYLFATKIIGGVKRKLREGNLTLFLSLFPVRIFKKITNYPELTLLLWNPYRKLEGKKVSLPFLSLFLTLTYPHFKILPSTYDIKKKFHHVLREYGVGKSQV